MGQGRRHPQGEPVQRVTLRRHDADPRLRRTAGGELHHRHRRAIPAEAPRWLRLTRWAASVTGYESPRRRDLEPGRRRRPGRAPPTVEVGLFVSSPFNIGFVQGAGQAGLQRRCDRRARRVRPCPPWSRRPPADWVYPEGDAGTECRDEPQPRPVPGGMTEVAGSFTIIGDGDIAWYGIPSFRGPDARDLVNDSLQGVQIGLLAMVVLGVLAATAGYRTGMIRATLVASPAAAGSWPRRPWWSTGCAFDGRAGRQYRRVPRHPADPAPPGRAAARPTCTGRWSRPTCCGPSWAPRWSWLCSPCSPSRPGCCCGAPSARCRW